MASQELLRVAVIGVGALGRHHARILSEMEGVDLVAVADVHHEQAAQVAEAYGCEWTHDYRTLLGKVDAVSVVVPTFLHRQVVEAFLCRSVPVLVEKPLAADVVDGAVLVRLAREHGVPLQVGHIERFNPAFQHVAEWTAEPKYVRCERISPYAFRSMDIGVVHDLMIHDIELVLALTGEMPVRVEAFGVSLVGGQEDCAQARLYFEQGGIADITVSRVSPLFRRSLQCWSERGCIAADLQTREVIRYSPGMPMLSGELPFELARDGEAGIADLKEQMFGTFIETERWQGSDADALTAELRSFVDCVRTGRSPLVSGVEGLEALRVAEQVLRSLSVHQWDGRPDGRIGPGALIEHHLPTGVTEPETGRAAA
jgi:predicted dehydrogenase